MLAAFQFFYFSAKASFLLPLISNHQCIDYHIILIVHYDDKHFENYKPKVSTSEVSLPHLNSNSNE